jgi:hypothetical protein
VEARREAERRRRLGGEGERAWGVSRVARLEEGSFGGEVKFLAPPL